MEAAKKHGHVNDEKATTYVTTGGRARALMTRMDVEGDDIAD